MHFHDFLLDLDVTAPGEVDTASALNIGINQGEQIFPSTGATDPQANRLLVFAGTAVTGSLVGHDSNLARGVVRVRLQFSLPNTLIFKSAGTVAALASLHGEGDEDDWTFAVLAVNTVTDPSDGGSLPNPQGLPTNELYVLIDAAYQGDGTQLARLSYQANVLVQDTEPDLDSLLLSAAGQGNFVSQLPISVTGGSGFQLYDLQVTLTGTVPQTNGPAFVVNLQSDHLQDVPLAQLLVIDQGRFSAILQNDLVFNTAPDETVTLTATNPNTNTTRSATITITRNR